MKTPALILAIAAGLLSLMAPVAVQAQNQQRVAVCDRLYSDRCVTVGAEGASVVSSGPTSSTTAALAATATASAASSLSRNAPGNLYSWQVTTGAVAGYVLVVNATTAPADGAISPMQCVAVAASSTVGAAMDIPERFSTGITVLFSTTGCFTLTKSATAFIRLRAL